MSSNLFPQGRQDWLNLSVLHFCSFPFVLVLSLFAYVPDASATSLWNLLQIPLKKSKTQRTSIHMHISARKLRTPTNVWSPPSGAYEKTTFRRSCHASMMQQCQRYHKYYSQGQYFQSSNPQQASHIWYMQALHHGFTTTTLPFAKITTTKRTVCSFRIESHFHFHQTLTWNLAASLCLKNNESNLLLFQQIVINGGLLS